VDIVFPDDFAPRGPDGYFDPGDWRVILAPDLKAESLAQAERLRGAASKD
jgi:hypothetical protein